MKTLNDFGAERFESTLDNGIRVVLFHRQHAPIYTRAVLHSGSGFDPENREGSAHLIEHMIVNGSAKFPSKDVLSEHIESIGGSMGAMTSQEVIMVNTEVPGKEDFSKSADVFEATLCNPLMDEAVFENEKNIVIKEITRAQSNPDKVLYQTTTELLFNDTHFQHGPLGTIDSVSSITYKEMIDTYEVLFDASRITFVASGDISIHELVDALNKLPFKTGKNFVIDNKVLTVQPSQRIHATYMDLKQVSLFMGFYSAPVYSKKFLNIFIAPTILSGGRSSRLTKILRYQKGLIYSINPSRHVNKSLTVHGLKTDTSSDKVQTVISEIMKEIQNISQNGVNEKEIQFVQNKLIKSFKIKMQTSVAWVDFHSYGEALSKDIYRPLHDYANQIEVTTVDEINSTIKEFMTPERIYVTLVGVTKAESVVL